MALEHLIILIDKAIYHMKKKSFRRRISCNDIKKYYFSKLTNEFVIHRNDDEYDYQYIHQNTDLIIYFRKNNNKLFNLKKGNKKG